MPGLEPDPAAIERLVVLGGESLVAQVAALFAEYGSARVEQLHAAWAEGDLDRIANVSHSLHSSAAQLGLTRLAVCAEALENCGRDGDRAGVGIAMEELEDHFRRALSNLELLVGPDGGAPTP